MNRREVFMAMLTLPFAAVLPKPHAAQPIFAANERLIVTLDGRVVADAVLDKINEARVHRIEVTDANATNKYYRVVKT